jgi:tetratricopeptide (TPR) repeat protein
MFLQKAGQFKKAVQDWKELEKLSERNGNPSRSTALNGLAYAQALAQQDLDDALMNVNKALALSPDNPAILDTRGYLLYLTKEYEAALVDMNGAVNGLAPLAARLKPDDKQSHWERILRSSVSARVELENYELNFDRTIAVLHYHRALILLALGREKDAEADLARVRQLIGQEPDETLF